MNRKTLIEDGKPFYISFTSTDWKQKNKTLISVGYNKQLWANFSIGRGNSYSITAELSIENLQANGPSFVVGINSVLGFYNASGQIYVQGDLFDKSRVLAESIVEGKFFTLQWVCQSMVTKIFINHRLILQTILQGMVLSPIGFCSNNSTLAIKNFSIEGNINPIDPLIPRQSRDFNIPTIDLANDSHRQTVIDREKGQYLGHPTTVLLDNKTMCCVYPKGHGEGALVLKRSEDGGLSWSNRLDTPKSWETSKEIPTIYALCDSLGKRRLVIFSGCHCPLRMAISEDDGTTWRGYIRGQRRAISHSPYEKSL